MRTCNLSNFNKDKHSGSVRISNIRGISLLDYLGEIESRLEKVTSFSLDFKSSNDPDNYALSIEDLCNYIIEELSSKENLPFTMDRASKVTIKKYFKGRYLPKPPTDTDKNILAVIKGTDLITEDERADLRFNEVVRNIYGSSRSILNMTRQSDFAQTMRLRLIINPSSREIIWGLPAVNKAIQEYMSEQYAIIKAFVDSLGFDHSLYPNSLFKENPNLGIKTINQNYTNALLMLYNYLLSKKENETLEEELEEGWISYLNKEGNRTLYEAVNAYINLTYIDQAINKSFGGYIKVDENMNTPITATLDGVEIKRNYKYSITSGNANMVHTWGTDDNGHDSLNEMAKFSSTLIESIPLWDYNKNAISYGYMQTKLFVSTFTLLRNIAGHLEANYKELAQALYTLDIEPEKKLNTVFENIFSKNNKNLLRDLEKLKFDQNYVNYLYSVYRTVFKGKNSWLSIENDFRKKNGIVDRYNTVDTLVGVITSNVVMNYLQTLYDYDREMYVTGVKDKYNIGNNKFDIVNNVNLSTLDNDDKAGLLERFKINKHTSQHYTIQLNNFTIDISSNRGLLYKGRTASDVTIKDIKEFDKIDLTSSGRKHLNSRTGLSDVETKFIDILDFVDTMLGTNFGKDEAGLDELYIFLRANSNGIRELLTSASRALIVTDIYNLFENATKEDGSSYSRSELPKFLDDSNVYDGKITELSKKDRKTYFIERYDGSLLNVVMPSMAWIDDLARIRAIMAGDTTKSVTSDLSGNKLPNYSPSFLGGKILEQIAISNERASSSAYLLFAQNPSAIINTVINTDIKTIDGTIKQIKSASEGELLYDSFINKFVIPYLDNKSIYTQPTTYSDKTKFILYQSSLTALGIPMFNDPKFNEVIESKIIDTVGRYYKSIYNEVVNDLLRIFPGQNVTSINNWLKLHSEEDLMVLVDQYNKNNPKNRITLYRDTHYRIIKGKKLSINELLYDYENNLYTPENLHRRLENEKLQFASDFLSKRIAFLMSYENGQLNFKDPVTKFASEVLGTSLNSWVKDSYLVLGIITKSDGTQVKITANEVKIEDGVIKLDKDDTFLLNPVLNAYFMTDNLIGNNLRYTLTGSEINHKIKALAKMDLGKNKNLWGNTLLKYNPNWNGNTVTLYDLNIAIKQLEATKLANNDLLEPKEYMDYILMKKLYDKHIYSLENLGLNAQFKRNVIIPGTIRPYLLNRLDGIRSSMKIAVINDVDARVYNLNGDGGGIDAHDGSALINPFTSILENNSLQDNEVGLIKKPIHHFYDDRLGVATLLKYAVDTITNQWMRLAEGNDFNGTGIRLNNIFKKMTNVKWHNEDGTWAFGPIDLLTGCHFKEDPTIDFSSDILKGNQLFYRDGRDHYEIKDFGMENGIYYTIELKVDNIGKFIGEEIKYYHYFSDLDEHIKSTELVVGGNTIDSLYQLHAVLGGIYSESKDSEGVLQYSEASNKAVTNFIINVANPDENESTGYHQPLKEAMIDMIANNSAVKNGAGNVNSRSAWYKDDVALRYMEVGTLGYGVQMDADHTADEAHMTEFSLVISSLDAGGRLHSYVALIYQALGKVAIEASEIELDAIEEFRTTADISKVYDVIGRTIINNFSSGKNDTGLAQAILNSILSEFNLNTNHGLDRLKIPFSDRNLYSSILSTFVSVINKKSIKRQYPGSGTVMVPAYDMSMIYLIGDRKYLYEDLIKLADQEGFTSSSTDLRVRHRDMVRSYLLFKLEEYENQAIIEGTDKTTDFMVPAENYIILWEDLNGVHHRESVSLNTIEDYYACTENIHQFLANKGFIKLGELGIPENINLESFRYYKNLILPRNLKPAEITFDWIETLPSGESVIHHVNLFTHWKIKNFIKGKKELDDQLNEKLIDKLTYTAQIIKLNSLYNVLSALDEIDKDIYTTPDGVLHLILNKKSKAAELIMSNLFKSKFGLKNGESLAEILNDPNYFKASLKESVRRVNSESYDMVFTLRDGHHLYITFKPLFKNSDNISANLERWRYTVKKDFEYPKDAIQPNPKESRIIHRVYASNKNNIPLYEVGREITRPDIRYDKVKKRFVYIEAGEGHKAGDIVSNLKNFTRMGENQVIEYIEFISKHRVTEYLEGQSIEYTVLNVNTKALREVCARRNYSEEERTITHEDGTTEVKSLDDKFALEVDNFIGKLLSNIYNSSDYSGILINNKMTKISQTTIQHAINGLANSLKHNPMLRNYLINDISKILKGGTVDIDNNVTFSGRLLQNALNHYINDLSEILKTSFLKSLMFTASRIPAQTLQSFMLMENVGFTGVSTNQCFVSHFQAWLQGSDY